MTGKRTTVLLLALLTVLLACTVSGCARGGGLLSGGVFPTASDPVDDLSPAAREGALPDEGVTVDSTAPGIVRLSPDIRAAVTTAAADAADQGVTVRITSGWRSYGYQQRLFTDAVARYGSVREAARLVAAPDMSRHVTGDAVDIGPTEAADWMIRNGAAYGLCQIFSNETWHFELVPDGRCPDLLTDASAR